MKEENMERELEIQRKSEVYKDKLKAERKQREGTER